MSWGERQKKGEKILRGSVLSMESIEGLIPLSWDPDLSRKSYAGALKQLDLKQ